MQLKTALRTQTRVTAQTVLATGLLRLSGAEVEEAVKRELAENPALERKESCVQQNGAFRTPAVQPRNPAVSDDMGDRRWDRSWDGNDGDPVELLISHESPIDQLLNQARLVVPATSLPGVSYLINLLDEHGFLKIPEGQLERELGVSGEYVRDSIAWLHQLEPPGIGARDLRECFLLQCADLEARGVGCKTVFCVLEKAWDHFVRMRWDLVCRCTGLSRQEIDAVLQFMRHNLYPYPLLLLTDMTAKRAALTRPDLIVWRDTQGGVGRYRVEIPGAEAYTLQVSPTFQMALRVEGAKPDAQEWIGQAIERSRLFIAALEQRWKTLRRIGEFIAGYQSDFFERGPRHLRPLTRAEVARQLSLHESTISRAVSGKILQLPNGRLILLSDLFDRSLAAKEAIGMIVAGKGGRPLSDREIAAKLHTESICLSRRTVTKYRRELGLPAMGHPGRISESSKI